MLRDWLTNELAPSIQPIRCRTKHIRAKSRVFSRAWHRVSLSILSEFSLVDFTVPTTAPKDIILHVLFIEMLQGFRAFAMKLASEG